MIKYTIRKLEEKVPEEITCDICKKTYHHDSKDDWMEIQEFHHVRFRGGFDSVFGDDVAFKADICQHCLKNILGQYITEDEGVIL